jgi:hypothetical protein
MEVRIKRERVQKVRRVGNQGVRLDVFVHLLLRHPVQVNRCTDGDRFGVVHIGRIVPDLLLDEVPRPVLLNSSQTA